MYYCRRFAQGILALYMIVIPMLVEYGKLKIRIKMTTKLSDIREG
jgi:hypothetical protein